MTEQATPIGYVFKVLSDKVAEADLFEDKTHENVSHNLFQLIGASETGITIGLEGSWGSGKSTVISLLREKLSSSKKDKTFFFMFDAWAHDGDPLRRIFLESLINEIDPKEQDAKLQDIAREISGRKKTVVVSGTKGTSKLGKWISLSALLIPLGAALVSKLDFQNIVGPWSPIATSLNLQLALGLPLALAPFFVLLVWRLKGEKKNGKIVWDIFTTESTENYTQDITENGERTTIEFEGFFRRIIQHATSSLNFKRVVVVIDNLDRVDSSHAKNIWSTLQTFFQQRSCAPNRSGDVIANRLWFIIPYDRTGFSSIWSESIGKDSGVSKSFLEKCFQVKAEVPQPVMSGWIKYFEDCVAEALTGWPPQEREQLIASYQHYNSKLESSPTPRKIRSVINQTGMMGLRWGGQMLPQAICLYSILRLEHTEEELRGFLLGNTLPYNLDDNDDHQRIKMELAGMLFGVTKERGVQLLLGPEIQSALQSGNGGVLKSLLSDHGGAFWISWNAIKSRIFPTSAHADEYLISFTNAVRHGLYENRSKILLDINRLFDLWRGKESQLDFDEKVYSTSINNLIELSDKREDIRNWATKVAKDKLLKTVSSIDTDVISKESIVEVRNLIDVAKVNGGRFDKDAYGKLDPANWAKWLELTGNSNVFFGEVMPKKDTITAIADAAFSGTNPVEKSAIDLLLKTIILYPDSSEWDGVALRLSKWMTNAQRELNVDAAYKLAFEILSNSQGKSSARISACIKAEPFWQISSQENFSSEKHIFYLAAHSFSHELQDTSFVKDEVKKFWSSEKSPDQVEEIFSTLSKSNQLALIWGVARDPRNAAAIQVLRDNIGEDLYSLSEGMRFIDEYDWVVDGEIEGIVSDLHLYGGAQKAYSALKSDHFAYHKCLYILSKYGTAESKEFVNCIVKSISTEDWLKSLETVNDLLKCIGSVDHKFKDAFEEFFIKSFSTKVENEEIWGLFDSLVEKTIDTRILLQKLTLEYFDTTKDKLDKNSFEVISNHFSPYVNSVSGMKVMEKLIVWLDDNNWGGISWLSSVTLPLIDAPLDSLATRVTEKLELIDNEANKAVLLKIVSAFKINLSNGRGSNEEEPELEAAK